MNLFSKESLASGLKSSKEALTSGLKSGKESLTGGLKSGKESLTSGFKSLANPLKALANNAKKILTTKEEPQNQISDLIFIYPRLFWMTFPTKEKIKELSTTLNTQFPKGNYYIWNVGEQKYDTAYFNNQVAEYNFVGYPCPPFQFILLICKSILEWLNSDKDNVAIIHCQSNAGRSSIIISCILALLKVVNHPMEALTYFCNKLQLNDTSFLLPSQKQAIKNFANLMDNIQLNDKVITLQKIVLSEAPEIIEETKEAKNDENNKEAKTIRPYLQVFRGSKAIYNHLSKEKLPKAYTLEDKDIEFEVNVDITDDILIRCRNYKSDEERTSIFRLVFVPCLNFGETIRLYKRDIDFSTHIKVSDNFYLELFVKPGEQDNQDIAVISKLKADCIHLAEEYKKKKMDKSSQKIVAVEREEDIKNKFDIVDTSKEGSDRDHDGSEDGSRDSHDILTPSTDNKLQKFFTSIQQEDKAEGEEEEEEDEDLDDYISKLENKGA